MKCNDCYKYEKSFDEVMICLYDFLMIESIDCPNWQPKKDFNNI